MRHKIGRACMALGSLLMAAALLLFVYNRIQDGRAGQSVVDILPRLVEQLPEQPVQPELHEQLIPPELRRPQDLKMTEMVIDGDAYIGYLSIPSLELELPILSDWDYDLLQKAPCRYTGSTKTDDLVLMAHNFDKHFGRIADLNTGDLLYFTDMDGIVHAYTVHARDVLLPTAIEEMTSGHFDLTLFTCTYGGKSRVTICCDRLET
ncbi:MAG: sortase [Oscillospiraceae bacterium]|nr:sortase [Oscillospiraceae bacterium]